MTIIEKAKIPSNEQRTKMMDMAAHKIAVIAIRAELHRLSNMSTQAIVDELRISGTRGHRGNPCDCPMAIHLCNLPELREHYCFTLTVGTQEVAFTGYPTLPECFVTPASVRQFIQLFDQGQFPELDAPLSRDVRRILGQESQ